MFLVYRGSCILLSLPQMDFVSMVTIPASGVHIWAQTLCRVSGTKRNTQNKHVALTNEFHSPRLNLFSLAMWSFPSWPVVTVKSHV